MGSFDTLAAWCKPRGIAVCCATLGAIGALVGCALSPFVPEAISPLNPPARSAVSQINSGSLQLLTYNVAGLPEWLSPSHPSRNLLLVSPLLSDYDLVFAQEDWAYHEQLVSQATQPYREGPGARRSSFLGDGLSLLSRHQVNRTTHVTWDHCSGYLGQLNDCLADKGFAVTHLTLSGRVGVDVINLHADAGQSDSDSEARRHEFEQLAQYIRQHADGHAVIVAGDTNLEPSNSADAQIGERFLQQTGLTDSCTVLHCNAPGIDRVFFRSSDRLHLAAEDRHEDPRFIDDRGEPLSDHPALAVNLNWQLQPPRAALFAQR